MSTTAIYTGHGHACGGRVTVVRLSDPRTRMYFVRDDHGLGFYADRRELDDIRWEDGETPVVEEETDAAKLMRLIRVMRQAAFVSGVHADNPRHSAHATYHQVLTELIAHVRTTIPGARDIY
jgi:hypothetical protein